MQLPQDTKIAGLKTVKDWNRLRKVILDFNDKYSWAIAYKDFYLSRLKYRYLNPIDSIREDGNNTGEGFSIMTLMCSLIEFLESTYQGRNYKFRKRGDPVVGTFEYEISSEI